MCFCQVDEDQNVNEIDNDTSTQCSKVERGSDQRRVPGNPTSEVQNQRLALAHRQAWWGSTRHPSWLLLVDHQFATWILLLEFWLTSVDISTRADDQCMQGYDTWECPCIVAIDSYSRRPPPTALSPSLFLSKEKQPGFVEGGRARDYNTAITGHSISHHGYFTGHPLVPPFTISLHDQCHRTVTVTYNSEDV